MSLTIKNPEYTGTGHRSSLLGLPQELIDIVVGHLADDIDTLKSCALMGPAFLIPCRLYLFRDVKLGPRHFCEDRESTLSIFAAIPSLERTIVSLTISSGKPDAGGFFPRRFGIDPEFFVALLRKMPSLHTIIFDRCAVEPKGEAASMLLPQDRWDHPRLRLLSISPSYQVSPVVDIFRTMAIFRQVPVDSVALRHDYDPPQNADPERTVYVDEQEYEALRGWHVGTLYVRGRSTTRKEIQSTTMGLLSAGVADVLKIDHWGLPFLQRLLDSFRSSHGWRNMKSLKLEVVPRPARFLPDAWGAYSRCTTLQSVTFIFNMHSIVERFSAPLLDCALPHLPVSVRTIGFEVCVDSKLAVAPHTLLTWWDNRMQWARLPRVLGRFTTLATLEFGVAASGHVEQQLLVDLNREMEAIVRKQMSEMALIGKVRFNRLNE